MLYSHPMDRPPTKDSRLERVRDMRRRTPPDLSLQFLKPYFKQQIEKPYRQLAKITGLWIAMVPGHLLEYSRLEGLTRGVLRVGVDSSSHLYELDRLMRGGLEAQLIQAAGSITLRRVRLTLVRVATSSLQSQVTSGESPKSKQSGDPPWRVRKAL